MFEGRVRRQDRIVGFYDRCTNLRRRIDGELQLAFLAVVDGQSLHQEGSETRSSTSSEGMEHQKTLENKLKFNFISYKIIN